MAYLLRCPRMHGLRLLSSDRENLAAWKTFKMTAIVLAKPFTDLAPSRAKACIGGVEVTLDYSTDSYSP